MLAPITLDVLSPGVKVVAVRDRPRGRRAPRRVTLTRPWRRSGVDMDMTRRIAAVAVVSLFALVVTAVADAGGKRTYRASLAPVNPAATTAGVGAVRGKAQLVDGKRNNKISLHVRGLAPRTTYIWHIHQGSCAATGAPLPGWTYRSHDGAGNGTLTTNHSGGANTKARSDNFNADPAQAYSVNVHVAATTNGLPAGTIVACGDLRGKLAKAHTPHPVHQPHPPREPHKTKH
jgi:hypothetical protein